MFRSPMLFRSHGPVMLLTLALLAQQLGGQQDQKQTESDVVGEVFASDASVQGSVIFASGGARLLSGSTVSAGTAAAAVRLKRGGEVRVCPGSNVQVNSTVSRNQQRELVLSLDAGMLEAHYSLPAVSDSVVTPDFRITLIGPGDFHVAIGADAQGNTCVQPLAGNNAALIVNELMGEASYQVKPNQGVYFPNGRVKDAVATVPACGCPTTTLQHAKTAEPPLYVAPQQKALEVSPAKPPINNVTQPLPALQSNDVHVQVDAPVIFSAAEVTPALESGQLARLPLTRLRWFTEEQVVPPTVVTVSAPAPENKPPENKVKEKKKGFFGRLRGMFAAIFGR